MITRDKQLEFWVANKLKEYELDPNARPTKASGASTEIGDVLNNLFYVECKFRSTKNITINRKVWYKLLAQVPEEIDKLPIYVLENFDGDRFVVMDGNDFFAMISKYIKDNNG